MFTDQLSDERLRLWIHARTQRPKGNTRGGRVILDRLRRRLKSLSRKELEVECQRLYPEKRDSILDSEYALTHYRRYTEEGT